MKSSKKNSWFMESCVILFFTELTSGFGCSSRNGNANVNTGEDEKVIFFEDPIRIGDDQDYNATHDSDFHISTSTGLSYKIA